uniref:Uncharacterized protein n=1 Tax=Rhizophora mucronata TaxID=61149 RepID=A0A2P2PGT6_RHIMU
MKTYFILYNSNYLISNVIHLRIKCYLCSIIALYASKVFLPNIFLKAILYDNSVKFLKALT